MSCFNELASKLSIARKNQASTRINIWGRRTWEELFDQDENGRIRPQEAAGYFTRGLFGNILQDYVLLGDLPPAQLERLICKKYKEYKRAGFWKTLGMWFTEPVGRYEKIYTLVTLRELQKQCNVVSDHASQMGRLLNPDLNAFSNYFNVVMGFLGNCLSSLFPRKLGFFTKFFGSKKMFCHIEDLGQFRKKAYLVLKDTIGKSYAALAKKTHACSSERELNEIQGEITAWQQEYDTSISDNTENSSVDARYKKKYQDLARTLVVKSRLLSGIAGAALSKLENNMSDPLSPSIQEQMESKYTLLSRRLANLQHGCTLQFWSHTRSFNHTYVLDNDSLLNDWRLLYYRTSQSEGEEIDVRDVPGLYDLLSHQIISRSAAERLLYEYHQGIMTPIPVQEYRRAISCANPLNEAGLLLQAYSNQIEKKLLEESADNNFNAIEIRNGAGQLHACLDYLLEKNQAFIPVHANIEEAGILYSQLARDIATRAVARKKSCADRIVYHREQQSGVIISNCITSLEKEYRLLQESEEFARLSVIASHLAAGLAKMADAEIRRLRELGRVLSMIHMNQPDEWNVADMLGISPEMNEWEEHVSRAFEQMWEQMPKQEDANTRKILGDTAKECFYHYMQPGKTLQELKKIYEYAERIKSEYLGKLQQETRTLVISAQPEKLENVVELVAEGLMHVNEAITQLQEKLDRNLKFPGTAINLYSQLVTLMVMRVEGAMWGLWDKDILTDKRCGLVFAPTELVEEDAQRLRWSHFIYTPDNDLYYYCKQKNTFDKCCLFDPYDIEKFNEMFPQKTYIKFLEPRQLEDLGRLITHTFKRDEDRITIRIACELAEKEISNLKKILSSLYHPDKYPDGEKWQKILNNKKDNALERLEKLLRTHQRLISEFANLNFHEKYTVPDWLGIFTPDWIKTRRHSPYSLHKMTGDYHDIILDDERTEKNFLSSKAHLAEINERREKIIIKRRDMEQCHEKHSNENTAFMKEMEENRNANEQEHEQSRQATAKQVKYYKKNSGTKYLRGLKAVSGHKHFHRNYKRTSYAGLFYSRLINNKNLGDGEKSEFTRKKGYM